MNKLVLLCTVQLNLINSIIYNRFNYEAFNLWNISFRYNMGGSPGQVSEEPVT